MILGSGNEKMITAIDKENKEGEIPDKDEKVVRTRIELLSLNFYR